MKKYFTFAVVATMFAACSNEVIEPQVDALTGMPIQVKTNVANLVESRVVAGMDSEADFSTFYLRITGDTEYFAVMKKETDGSWKGYTDFSGTTPLDMVWANGNEVAVSAIMSNSIGWSNESYNTNGDAIYVYEDQSDYLYKNSDMLYMSPTKMTPAGDGSITVNFSHLMSKVRISIDTNSNSENDPLTSVKVNGTKKRFFTPATNTWGNTFSSLNISAHYDSYTDGTSVYEVILVPQEVAGNTFSVSFTMDGKDYQWTSSEAVKLESGKLYTLALQVPDNDPTGDAVIVSVNVSNWPTEPVVLGDTNNDAVVVE